MSEVSEDREDRLGVQAKICFMDLKQVFLVSPSNDDNLRL